MNNILYIAIESTQDFINLYQVMDSHPKDKITVLTTRELESYITLRDSRLKYKFIDKNNIKKSFNSKLIPPSHAFDMFFDSLEEIVTTSWDTVYNFTPSKISVFATRFLKYENIQGFEYQDHEIIATDKKYILLQNNLFSNEHLFEKNNFFSFDYKQTDQVKTSLRETINKNFEQIRKSAEKHYFEHIIGVDLSSLAYKKIDLIQIFNELLDDAKIYPILLLEKNNLIQRNLQLLLNKTFKRNFISIEYEPTAIKPVLDQIDCVISSSGFLLDQTLLSNTKSIIIFDPTEVSFNKITIKKDDIIIKNQHSLFNYSDLYFAYQLQFSNSSIKKPHNIQSIFYKVWDSGENIIPIPINGKNTEDDINLILTRLIYTKEFLGNNISNNCLNQLFDEQSLYKFYQLERNNIELFLKSLLNCIRSLKNAKNSQENNFIENLSHILSFKALSGPISLLTLSFEFDLNKIENKKNKYMLIEKSLFNLKKQVKDYLILFSKVSLRNKTNEETFL